MAIIEGIWIQNYRVLKDIMIEGQGHAWKGFSQGQEVYADDPLLSDFPVFLAQIEKQQSTQNREPERITDPFYAQQMSDGTLKIFAYLLMLNDPSPPPFIRSLGEEGHTAYAHAVIAGDTLSAVSVVES